MKFLSTAKRFNRLKRYYKLPMSKLMLLHMFWINKCSRTQATGVRLLSFMFRVDVAVKQSLSSELCTTIITRVATFTKMNMANMCMQVLLLVKPGTILDQC